MEKKSILRKTGIILGRLMICVGTSILGILLILVLSMNVICNGGSSAAREMFVSTILETGALKFLAKMYLTTDEINDIVQKNSMGKLDDAVDENLIRIVAGNEEVKGSLGKAPDRSEEATVTDYRVAHEQNDREEIDEDGDGIIVCKIAGSNFLATMLIVKDPSRVTLESYYNDHKAGAPLDKIVSEYGGVAGINGGLYHQNETGGRPYGVTVSNGVIQTNKPQESAGLVLIAMTYDNILVIEDVSKLDEAGVEKLVKDKKIRDGCCFQEESKDSNNHFVQLMINGHERELNGSGSGRNPRTAIGQRADGSILLLVTSGRGAEGHLGASASDLIGIMSEYGAVNAANLDGGSSSSMVLNGEYLMESVTFRKANTSWNLPVAFVVK